MPNTPALVRSGASVYVCGSKATEKDGVITKKLLESIGTCDEVSEGMLDPVTALSGSGPAYVSAFYLPTTVTFFLDYKTILELNRFYMYSK